MSLILNGRKTLIVIRQNFMLKNELFLCKKSWLKKNFCVSLNGNQNEPGKIDQNQIISSQTWHNTKGKKRNFTLELPLELPKKTWKKKKEEDQENENLENKENEDLPVVAAMNNFLNYTFRVTHMEREATMEREASLYHNLTIEELEIRGLALFGMRIDSNFCKLLDCGNVDIRLVRSGSLNDLGAARGFRTGKIVEIIKGGETDRYDKKRLESWQKVVGIISGITDRLVFVRIHSISNFILEALNENESETSEKNQVYLLKRSEESIYEKQLGNLSRCRKNMNQNDVTPVSRDIFSKIYEINSKKEDLDAKNCLSEHKVTLLNPSLDQSQIEAVNKSAFQNPVSVIHGPPGTGKTTTLASCVLSALGAGKRVLVVAPSHAACDAVTLAILKDWPCRRLEGHVVQKVYDADRHSGEKDGLLPIHDLLGLPEEGNLIRVGNELRLTAPELKVFLPQNALKSDQSEIRVLLRDLKLVRQELLDRNGSQKKGELMVVEEKLVEQLRMARNDLEDQVIEGAKVVLITNASAMGQKIVKRLQSQHFDLLCIDEAGFSIDSQVIPLITRASKIILSGDHLQLPPVIQNPDGRQEGHGVSLLERIADLAPEWVSLLTVQYRSNKLISDWSSNYFYWGQLMPDDSVKDRTLSDLDGVANSVETRTSLLFVDTSGMNYLEESDPFNDGSGEDSIANYGEACVVEQLVKKYLSLGVNYSHIGIITPYWAQVALLRSLIWTNKSQRDIEIRTVDGYQGREKELIILSLVRSNPNHDVGFLEETRRINVSVTRGRRCCLIVGDGSTLKSDSGLKNLINYCKSNNAIVNVSSII